MSWSNEKPQETIPTGFKSLPELLGEPENSICLLVVCYC